jgi:signal peptidase I
MADEPSVKPPPLPVSGRRKSRPALGVVLALSLAVCLVLLRLFALVPMKVPTGAMQPAIMGNHKLPDGSTRSGDHLFVEKLSLLVRAPARGDIVVFKTKGINHPYVPQDQLYIKRVVGIPGDRILFEPPGVRVNGQLLTAPPIFKTIAAKTNGHCGYCASGDFAVKEEIKLGEGEYFLAGDNSQNSLDSRYFGPIRRKQIIGRAAFIYYPGERMGIPK